MNIKVPTPVPCMEHVGIGAKLVDSMESPAVDSVSRLHLRRARNFEKPRPRRTYRLVYGQRLHKVLDECNFW